MAGTFKKKYTNSQYATSTQPDNPDDGFMGLFFDAANNNIPTVVESNGTATPLALDDGTIVRSYNLDGGAATSVYAPSQSIDCGGA